MTDLERRALLGDREAQEECMRQGIVLPCPCCGGKSKLKKGFPSRQIPHCRQAVVQCKECGVRTITHKQLPMERWQDVDKYALEQWNTRAAPPIGRCGTCVHNLPRVDDFGNPYILCGWYGIDMAEDGFCSDYEPKEADHGQE